MIDLPDNMFGFAIIPKTALRPNQQPYFAAATIILPAYSTITFRIGAGFCI